MGHLHRPHRPKVKIGDLVRLTKGEFCGTLASVEKVYKKTIRLHCHHDPIAAFWYPYHIVVKKSYVKKERLSDHPKLDGPYRYCHRVVDDGYSGLGQEPTDIRYVGKNLTRPRVVTNHSSRRIY